MITQPKRVEAMYEKLPAAKRAAIVPGKVMKSGDIDNRLKTIFDALRLPRSEEELGKHTPGDEHYCFTGRAITDW